MTLSLAHLFVTPLVVDRLAESSDINAVLAPIIMRTAVSSRAWQGGLPTGDNAAEAAAGRVIRHAIALADRFTQDEHSKAISRYNWSAKAWASRVEPGQVVEPLHCWDAFWIAQYFVEDGYGGSGARALAGELVIEDPRLPMPLAELPELRLRTGVDVDAPAYEPEIAVRPATGRLVMYPGWLRVRRRVLAGGVPATSLTIALRAVRR